MFSLLFPESDHLLESYSLPSLSASQPTDAASTLHHRSHTTVSTCRFRRGVMGSINLSPKEAEEKKPISLITVLVAVRRPSSSVDHAPAFHAEQLAQRGGGQGSE